MHYYKRLKGEGTIDPKKKRRRDFVHPIIPMWDAGMLTRWEHTITVVLDGQIIFCLQAIHKIIIVLCSQGKLHL